MIRQTAIVSLALTIAIVTSARCQPTEPVIVPLAPYAGTALRMLAVTLEGRPGGMIFDTGGGITLVNASDSLARSCTAYGRFAGFRATGELVTASHCGPLRLATGSLERRVDVVVFDLAPLLGSRAPQIGGLLALNAFTGGILTIDYPQNRLVVETAQSLEARIRTMRPVTVRITNGAAGDVEIFLEARARTGELWLELDSGNNGPTFLAPHAFEQLGIPRPAGTSVQELNVTGLGLLRMPVASRDMIFDGQFGVGFLERTVLTIDFARRKAWASTVGSQ